MRCKQCGSYLDDGALFCPTCKTVFKVKVPPKRFNRIHSLILLLGIAIVILGIWQWRRFRDERILSHALLKGEWLASNAPNRTQIQIATFSYKKVREIQGDSLPDDEKKTKDAPKHSAIPLSAVNGIWVEWEGIVKEIETSAFTVNLFLDINGLGNQDVNLELPSEAKVYCSVLKPGMKINFLGALTVKPFPFLPLPVEPVRLQIVR